MKKNELLSIWATIKGAKFGKLSGEAKVKYVQMFAKLSPVVKDFESYRDTISEKLMSEHDGFQDHLQEAQKYEAWMKDNTLEKPKMTEEEYKDFIQVVIEYNKSVAAALNEEAEKEVEVKFDKLTTTEYGCFIDSNDFTTEQAAEIMRLLCDQG